ncbi:hypothetical protein DyAD56_18685 [Dyella sp. AD56]|nr:hypothetical protein DyAD56_18685 [Dyella sp. AD56]
MPGVLWLRTLYDPVLVLLEHELKNEEELLRSKENTYENLPRI